MKFKLVKPKSTSIEAKSFRLTNITKEDMGPIPEPVRAALAAHPELLADSGLDLAGFERRVQELFAKSE